jgi:predicted O-methyltransferase YrrM
MPSCLTMMRLDNGPQFVDGLRDLIEQLPGALNMAEIGVYAGESTRLFVDSGKVRRLIAVDPWAGDAALHSPYPWSFVRATFLNWAMTQPNVMPWVTTSERAAQLVDPQSLDFVYIDANHKYEPVRQDILLWRARIRPGGFIGGHDFSRDFVGVMRAVVELLGVPKLFFEDTSWLFQL